MIPARPTHLRSSHRGHSDPNTRFACSIPRYTQHALAFPAFLCLPAQFPPPTMQTHATSTHNRTQNHLALPLLLLLRAPHSATQNMRAPPRHPNGHIKSRLLPPRTRRLPAKSSAPQNSAPVARNANFQTFQSTPDACNCCPTLPHSPLPLGRPTAGLKCETHETRSDPRDPIDEKT